MPPFGYISADAGIFRILAQSDIFMYIKAYSEPITYSGIFSFRHIMQKLLKTNLCIFWTFKADSGIFRTLAYWGTNYFTHIQACSQSYTCRSILAHIRAYFSKFRHIQDTCITDSNNENQHLLFKSDSSFKSLLKSIWNIFLLLFQKETFNIFSSE